MFIKYDKDESGHLDYQEMQLLINEKMEEFFKEFQIKSEGQKKYMVDQLVKTVFRKIDHEYGVHIRHTQGKVSWPNFKDAFDLAMIETQQLH